MSYVPARLIVTLSRVVQGSEGPVFVDACALCHITEEVSFSTGLEFSQHLAFSVPPRLYNGH
jgi:hypothetical protein